MIINLKTNQSEINNLSPRKRLELLKMLINSFHAVEVTGGCYGSTASVNSKEIRIMDKIASKRFEYVGTIRNEEQRKNSIIISTNICSG